jgi:PAS domain S-box-containing protein
MKNILKKVASITGNSGQQELKEIEEKFRLLENELKQEKFLIDAISDQIYFKDLKSRFIRINKAQATKLGLEKTDQAIGKTDFDFFSNEHAQQAFEDEQEILVSGITVTKEEKETHFNRPDTWVSTIKMPLRDIDGNIIGTYGISRDITERKIAEDILIQRTNELKEAVVNLSRSNQELEQFAYVASHDLQEPLRMVSSYTQLLERRYKDKLDQDATDFINYAVDGANRMQRLINDLLEFSRVTTKGKPLVKLDLSAALGQAVANLQNKIQETGSMIVNDDLPFAYGDEGQLIRVFQNLLDNAMKFRGEAPPRINISAKNFDNTVQISIADNGIGIEKIYSERVFTIFQRLHTKAEYPGTGIGLAICKRTIERHGGKIWFESEPGIGTTFYFTLNIK